MADKVAIIKKKLEAELENFSGELTYENIFNHLLQFSSDAQIIDEVICNWLSKAATRIIAKGKKCS